ncbi:MAG: hypothetical protein WCL50_16515, partial [Spirochaetota bacterium]
MDQLLNEIRVSSLDPETNALLSAIPGNARDVGFTIHYNQSEDLYLSLPSDLLFPRLPIHHDVRDGEPSASYAQALKRFVGELVEMMPATFRGLTYYFDPAEILKPCFYRLYKVEETVYLFHLRVDLAQRPFEGEVMEQGTNDHTAAFRCRNLYIESDFIPLDAVMWEMGRVKAFKIHQLVSNTWIGETGRGHFVHGGWMDGGLTRFFSKLFLPDGSRTYPWFPIFCKYKTICASVPSPGPEARKRVLPLLHRAISFLKPEMEKIQTALKSGEFSDQIPEFHELRLRVPSSWREGRGGYGTKAYRNQRDMKEDGLATPDTPVLSSQWPPDTRHGPGARWGAAQARPPPGQRP